MHQQGEITISAIEKNLAKKLRNLFAPLKKLHIPALTSIEMALYEAVENGIEHGCLEIGFQLKRMLIEYKYYDKELRRRQGNPRFIKRNVVVSYIYTEDSIQFDVKDEGKGFDWKERFQNDEDNPTPTLNVSGSGLTIITTVFDSITFNKVGNEIKMIKYCKLPEEL
ncbi:ATP-binding protein [bacterium]|nr:ATP-binding protein [bacterium]